MITGLGGAMVDEPKTIIGAALEDVDGAPKVNAVVDWDGEEPNEEAAKTGVFSKALNGAPLKLEEADELPPKLNIPEVPLLNELPVLIPEADAEVPPKLKVGGVALTVVVVEEEELRPKLKTRGEALVVTEALVSNRLDVGSPPTGTDESFSKLDVGPPTVENGVGPDEEDDELKPKLELGKEPREVLLLTLNAGADKAENMEEPSETDPTPDIRDLLLELPKSEP